MREGKLVVDAIRESSQTASPVWNDIAFIQFIPFPRDTWHLTYWIAMRY